MNKLIKTLSILFATGLVTLAGCNTNELLSNNKNNSSSNLIEVPPSYGEKINEADYRDGGFISDYSHEPTHRECLNRECPEFPKASAARCNGRR